MLYNYHTFHNFVLLAPIKLDNLDTNLYYEILHSKVHSYIYTYIYIYIL